MTDARVCLIVLDGVGIGGAPDAAGYDDAGANTLGHMWERFGGLKLPNLISLGLGHILGAYSFFRGNCPSSYGKMKEVSAGKDTTSGHWEIAGLITRKPFPVFPNGFPLELMEEFERRIGRRCIGNVSASGTEIIKELGAVHQATGMPIVYTSADSVFQVAAHQETIPLEELYRICLIAREILSGDWAVARVIARPFVGSFGNYTRTENRRDFSVQPHGETILDNLLHSGREVIGIGKIEDIFAGKGLSRAVHTRGNEDGMRQTLVEMSRPFSGLAFVNLVDFDSKYGHRRDPAGFAAALESFDKWIPTLLKALCPNDTLLITADHGNDPTYRGTDHTREMVPLIALGRGIAAGTSLGVRQTFADVGASIADLLAVQGTGVGTSFACWSEDCSIHTHMA